MPRFNGLRLQWKLLGMISAIHGIAAVSQQQSESVGEMTAHVAEMAEQARELAGTAGQLRGLVAQFKLQTVPLATLRPQARAAQVR